MMRSNRGQSIRWLVAMIALGAMGCDANSAPAAREAPAPPPQIAPKPAGVGVGASTQNLENQGEIGKAISSPAAAFFRTKERIAFEIQIPKAVQLFEATEGRKPKSEEEFMARIIRENQIALPRLPEGQKYVYRPEEGELWVEPTQP